MQHSLQRLLLVFFSCLVQFSMAQERPWINYTTENGLPTNYVYGAIETDEGMIWIYTEDGAVRFDGHTFQTFTIADGLPDNDVYFIEKDSSGICWFSTFENSISYLEHDKINQVENCPDDFEGRIDIRNGVPMARRKGGYSPILPDKTFGKFYNHPEIGHDVNVRKAFQDFWLTINYEQNQVIFHSEDQPPKVFKSTVIGQKESFVDELINGPSDWIYVGVFSKGFFIYNQQEDSFKEYFWADFNIDHIRKRSIHIQLPYIFLNHGSGFVKIDDAGEIVDLFVAKDLAQQHEMRNFISDSKGNIWAGSRDGGLFFLSHHNRQNQKLLSSGTGTNIIEKIIPLPDNRLVFFADQDPPMQYVDSKLQASKFKDKMGIFTDAALLPDGRIVTTYPEALVVWDKDLNPSNLKKDFSEIKNNFHHAPMRSNRNIFFNLKALAWDHSSNSLISNSRNLLVFSFEKNKKLIAVDYPIRVKDLAPSSDSAVWVCSPETIYKHIRNRLDSVFSHPDLKYITKIYDAHDFLYIATENKGILRLELKTLTLSSILDIGNINSISDGKNESILVSSNLGVFRLDKKTGNLLKHYKTSSGLSANQVLYTYENQDELWVASSRGIDKILTSDKQKVKHKYELTLNNITVNNEVIEDFQEELILTSQQNTIKFSYNLLDYTSGGDITYYTKLSPLQNEWVISKTPEVTFLGLAPNEYAFELKAKRFNGEEISFPKIVNIDINPPLHKNPWTYLTAFLLAFIGFYFYIKEKQKQKEAEYEKEKRMNKKISETQLSALRSQMNPHFIFNALGAIQYFVQTKNTDLADDYLSEFALLMRRYLEASKQPTILLNDEIELLTLYTNIEAMRFDHHFKISFEIDPRLDLMDIRLPSVLIQPFVENAILHGLQPRTGSDGLLKISFSQKDTALLVKITDNGIGLEKALEQKDALHKSRGLENIIDRIKTLKMATGFEVTFTQTTPFPKNERYPGHEVLMIFDKLLA